MLHENYTMALRDISCTTQWKLARTECCKEWCTKGGSTSQLCGWSSGSLLCTGAITDAARVKVSKTLEEWICFQEFHTNLGRVTRAFFKIFDKDYRVSLESINLDQAFLQRNFTNPDLQFSTEEILSSGDVVCIRSRNDFHTK